MMHCLDAALHTRPVPVLPPLQAALSPLHAVPSGGLAGEQRPRPAVFEHVLPDAQSSSESQPSTQRPRVSACVEQMTPVPFAPKLQLLFVVHGVPGRTSARLQAPPEQT
jgi:hypothetical protein